MLNKKESARLRTIESQIQAISTQVKSLIKIVLKNTPAIHAGPAKVQTAPVLEAENHTVISCDASIKENPGGPSAIGFVIRQPGHNVVGMNKCTSATSNNQAEYDAVYEGLTTFFNLTNSPKDKVEVRSDSQLVIKQLNGEMKCNDQKLMKKRDAILALVKELPVPIEFVWASRNSTQDLEQANYLAQDLLRVSRH